MMDKVREIPEAFMPVDRLHPYVPLQEHLEKMMELQFNGMDTAINLARESMEKRLDTMNEFRDSLRDQASRFLPKAEFEASQIRITDEIKILNRSKDILSGKASQNSVILFGIISVTALVVGIMDLLVRIYRG
jgi:hypothetical protein